MTPRSPNYWALVPAAGSGSRMGGEAPKQFLRLGRQTVLEHSLEALWAIPGLAGLVLVSHDDPAIERIRRRFADRVLIQAAGGEQRCHSVLNGLEVLQASAQPDDWVLVHDAARPCVRRQDLAAMLDQLSQHDTGGVLGVPVRDTMKRTDARNAIQTTVERNGLWHAQTPQMFRYGRLKTALETALADGYEVTDEASAVEHCGYQPLMVEGHADNLKITQPEDLPLAAYFLEQQGRL